MSGNVDAKAAATQRKSFGALVVARALWYVKPCDAEIRTERLIAPRPGEARVKTLFSAISRGTERLVASGNVPQSEWQRMRAPLQEGEFSFPLKYGYSATGIVTHGAEELIGKTVFCLHPHQDFFHAPEAMLAVLPENIPAKRATLAANMETALNAHWDAGTGPGDKVLVIGAGIVGLLTAHLAKRIAGCDVTISDIDPARELAASKLGLTFARPAKVPTDAALIFHTSAAAAGLQAAIDAAAFEGRIIDMSWYGTAPVSLNLGGAFHVKRLQIISSQVGQVAPSRRASITRADRLKRAIALLDDPALDTLVEAEVPFADLPQRLTQIFAQSDLPPVVRYPD